MLIRNVGMDSGHSIKTVFSRKLAIVSAAIMVIFCVVITIQAVVTHENAIRHGKQIAQRLTNIQTDHIELTFSQVNLTLKAEADIFYYNSLFARPVLEEAEKSFKKWVSSTPPIAWAMLINNTGDVQVMVSKAEFQDAALQIKNAANESYFSFHKKNHSVNRAESVFISGVNVASDSGKRFIILSQPVFKYDGSFAGVTAAAINADYFFDFFRTIEIATNVGMGISISGSQLVLANRHSTIDPDVFKKMFESKQVQAGREASTIKHDGRKYIISGKKLSNIPAVINLVFDEDEILSAWKSDRMTDLIFLVLFTVFGGVLFSLIIAMAKQIQRAEESEKNALLANQAKSEFLAKMSHELRTPLNAIIGFSEMIESGYFGPLSNKKQQERVHDINLCGNHLLQLINDILDYTKGEAGKLEIHESEVAIPKVVEEAVKMLREKAKRKNIELKVHVPAELPKIMADERKIKQVFINLLSNAVKFTLNGGTVSIDVFINKKGDVEVNVTDSGIGIPQDDIPVALSVFGQVRNRHLVEEEGTGLGLPLCKMLAELHGGIFHLESEVGVGTKAVFTIPASRIAARKNPSA